MSRSAALPILLAVGSLTAQEYLWCREGRPQSHSQGWQQLRYPTPVGDVDRDGYQDVAVTTESPLTGVHSVLFLSGRDGSTLREYIETDISYRFYVVAHCGDVDQDGTFDYAVNRWATSSNPIVNFIEVRSGSDDRLIWSVRGPWGEEFGKMMVGDIDVNGDGRRDLLTASNWARGGGAVEAYDHRGQRLFRLNIYPVSIARFVDADGDGCDDFLVGAISSLGDRGAVWIYSGRTQFPLAEFHGQSSDQIGVGSVVGTGDVDRDGVVDVAGSSTGVFMAPVAMAFSGRTRQPLFTWRYGVAGGAFQTIASCDFDQDGTPDLLVTDPDPTGTYGVIGAYSLRDRRLVGVLHPLPSSGSAFATHFQIGWPQPGDPFPTVTIVRNRFVVNGDTVGQVCLMRSAPPRVRTLGSACTALPAIQPKLGYRTEPGRALIHLTGASPGTPAALLVGLSSSSWGGAPLPLQLDAFGFPGCRLYTSIDAVVAAGTGVGLDAGLASAQVPVLTVPLFGQWATLDPRTGRMAFSAGIRW